MSGDTRTIQFGKYKGLSFNQVPYEYLEWLQNEAKQRLQMVTDELDRRTALVQANMGLVERIVAVGYRELAGRRTCETSTKRRELELLEGPK